MMTEMWKDLVSRVFMLVVLLLSSFFTAAIASSSQDLFNFETQQLIHADLSTRLSEAAIPEAKNHDLLSLFSPENNQPKSRRQTAPQPACKTYPSDPSWPTESLWRLFNILLDNNALIKTVPEASLCYPEWAGPSFSAAQCQTLTASWNNSTLRIENPTSIRSILFQGMSCMPPAYNAAFLGYTVPNCTVGGFPEYTVNVSTVAQIQLAVNIARELNLRLVIKNTGHDFGAKSTGKGGLNVWTHNLKDYRFYPNYKSATGDYRGPAFKLAAGVQVFEANAWAKEYNVTLVGGEGKSVGFIGGYIQGGGHSPLTSIYGLAADHVLSIQLVTADGQFVTADAKTKSDLFWALRGGGAGTFGIVTSMVVKAFPQIKTTTLTYNVSTGGNFTKEKFWAMQRAYVDEFERLADLGYYSYYRIRQHPNVSGELYHDMTSMVAPNTSAAEFKAAMAPLFHKWAEIGVPYDPVIRESDNYSDAWLAAFPHEVWSWAMRQASRFFPRENLVDPEKRRQAFDAVKGVVEEGANMVLFNMRNGRPGANTELIDNAVNPAWRKVLMFAIMFVTWNVTDSPEYVTQLSRNLTYEWNPRWKALTPGGGTYMSESDYIEPNWQESFHGDKYPRLLEIKKKWDPLGVFYATNAVGSEEWVLGETIMGHLPSQNSRLCRK
ncbi:FAD binding domain-containing protein [Podospora australis]|uniref:FAD binding domain-containing protein n=1 Tax=Podospora australis TaxID=1536484 RepID=A0AAN6WSL6_9PEZI|nr:FAD binding domain-containing protein [Podospora australis]